MAFSNLCRKEEKRRNGKLCTWLDELEFFFFFGWARIYFFPFIPKIIDSCLLYCAWWQTWGRRPRITIRAKLEQTGRVTFLLMSPVPPVFSYCSNSEYWSQKRAQRGKIHSITCVCVSLSLSSSLCNRESVLSKIMRWL